MAIITARNNNGPFGLGAGDCPMTPSGDCNLGGGLIVNCNLVRECDQQTGAVHYEYVTPGTSPNVNINMVDPQTNMIIGYQNAAAKFVDTPDRPLSVIPTKGTSLLVGHEGQNILDTRQNVSNQQGPANQQQTTNKNASTGQQQSLTQHSGSTGSTGGSTSGSPLQNFSNLVGNASNWLEQETWGIKNSWLALGGAFAIAVAGGYVGGRRGRGF